MSRNRQGEIDLGGTTTTYELRRSKKARRVLLHVHDGGRIEVVVPWHVSYAVAEQFVEDQREWVQKTVEKHVKRRVKDRPVQTRLVSGALLPFFGRRYRLRIVCDPWRTRSSYGEIGDEISVFVTQRRDVRKVVLRWYRARAKDYFSERVVAIQSRVGVKARTIVVSDARSQWGSCIKDKSRLSLHWRLALGPVEVAEYVIAHEVAHLRYADHSRQFWATVRQLFPDYDRWRKWLRDNNDQLRL